MAEENSTQEKTEQPTPKRLQKAKEEGQVPRSKELTTSAVLIAGMLGLFLFGGVLAKKLHNIMTYNFSIERDIVFDTNALFIHLGHSLADAMSGLVPLFVILFLAAFIGPIALGGWMFSGKSLLPKLNRLNPVSGLKRMFSMKSLVELFKAIAKVVFVAAAAYFIMYTIQDQLLGLSNEGLQRGVKHSLELSITAAIVLAAVTIVITMIDVPFQIHEHIKKLKMSLQEVKDELKDTEGKPEVKSKIRQLQQQMSQQRMMNSVPEADVVITNPTHFSVALKYDPEAMQTPVLVAKGVDHVALRIREVAKNHGVEFVEAPRLARAIYHTTEIEDEIPQGLFVAVAQVLAYVFQLREYHKGRHVQKPVYPKNFEIPEDMQY